MLFFVALSVELLKLIPSRHSEVVDSLGVRFGVHEEVYEDPPYWALMEFVIMSCSCWTDKEVTKVDCCN